MSIRTDILNSIETTLGNVSCIKEVIINKVSPVDLDIVAFPAAFVYSDSEELVLDERSIIGFDTWDWSIVIEIWANDYANMDDILMKVHNTMYGNYRLDGNAENSYRTSMEELIIDPTKEIRAMILNYSVLYRHRHGNLE